MVLGATLLMGGGHLLAQPPGDNKPQTEKQQTGDKADKADKGRHKEADRDKKHHDRRAQRRKRIHQQLFKDIDLTQDQQKRVHAIMEEARAQRKAWREEHKDELREIRRQMRDARRSDDKEAAKAVHEKLRKLMADAPQHDDLSARLGEVLSKEQIAQFKSNVKEMRENWKKHHEKRRDKHHEAKDDAKAGPKGQHPDDKPGKKKRDKRASDQPAPDQGGDE